jgi:hypothetical protein
MLMSKTPTQAIQLRREMKGMNSIVGEMRFTLQTDPSGISPQNIASFDDALKSSIDMLEEMIEKIDKSSNAKQTEGIRRLKSPFKNKEIQQYINKIQSFKTTITLALQVEQRCLTYSSLLIGRHTFRQLSGQIQEIKETVTESKKHQLCKFIFILAS